MYLLVKNKCLITLLLAKGESRLIVWYVYNDFFTERLDRFLMTRIFHKNPVRALEQY